MIHDFEKMSSTKKANFLRIFFDQQRRFSEENLNGWTSELFLFDLNRIYRDHLDEILKKLCGKKSDSRILDIVFEYFKL